MSNILDGRTPKACLVAPFGYGKTTTAIGIWEACGKEQLLAIPPISCTSFPELARAIFDWILFVLPDLRSDIEAAHERFLVTSSSMLARRDERLFNIPFDSAMASIRDKLERGYLDFEDVSINLLAFLEEVTRLALSAGFRGVVIIIDEFQQLMGNAGKGVLVALRQLIWGLRTRQLPLGLLLTMDPDTERTLADRAGDILHRIKDDGLYLDFRQVYDREFPARLWQQYIESFGLDLKAQEAIDRPALDALGQLCERDDLSNGPRTVINVLQRAATVWMSASGGSYSPINLVDDLLSGEIRFDGDKGLLPALVGELLNFPYFQQSEPRSRTLKLLAAFPRGCSQQVARLYGLEEVWHELENDLRGEIVTELDEGLALVELQKVGRPANRLNVLLRRYWMQITDQQLFAEDAPRAFTEIIFPLLFPTRVHDLSGWTGQLQLSPEGAYTGIIEGTVSSNFPLRRIAVAVVSADSTVPDWKTVDDVDVKLVFRLHLESGAGSLLRQSVVARTIEVDLALSRNSEAGLQGGLSWIEHYLNPQPISAAVILSLLRYFARAQEEYENERDKVRIMDTVDRLREWLLVELFPISLFKSGGFEVIQAGQGGVKEFLHVFAVHCWPAYKPLIMHQHWLSMSSEYEAALMKAPTYLRTGNAVFRGSKAEIAALFGQARHASFQSRIRQYRDMLQLEEWKADEAAVRFVPHSYELDILGEVRKNGPMRAERVYHRLCLLGLASAEARVILRLVVARGLLVQAGDSLALPQISSSAELADRTSKLKDRIAAIPSEKKSAFPEVSALELRLSSPLTSPELDGLLSDLDTLLSEAERTIESEERTKRDQTRTQLLAFLPILATHLTLPGEGRLSNHLLAARRILEAERDQLFGRANDLVSNDSSLEGQETDSLLSKIRGWRERAELYEQWNSASLRIQGFMVTLQRLELIQKELPESAKMLRSGVEQLTQKARSVLAQEGLRKLKEIGKIQADLISLERDYMGVASTRQAAFNALASALKGQLSNLIGYEIHLHIPQYDPASDEENYRALFEALATSTSRALLFLLVEVTSQVTHPSITRTKLLKDLRTYVGRANDVDWLIDQAKLKISERAARILTALGQQTAELRTQDGYEETDLALHLMNMLSEQPSHALDISQLLNRVTSEVAQHRLVETLLHLHQLRALRLTGDYPHL